ncbi:hypothetical protein HDU84_005026 [Entophlyctis sp. JEL0112]|nr:hypothetical protein HDU84_005026 [Entophlyctis sp. JEL0112]
MSPIKPRASKDYVLGSDGDLAKEGGGKYSYARPGTLLHEAPQLIAHEKKKRPLDGRYGKPLIAVEVADRNRLEHAKIAGSLAYTTMIRAQEEQAIRSKREENAFKRQNCDKCEGIDVQNLTQVAVSRIRSTVRKFTIARQMSSAKRVEFARHALEPGYLLMLLPALTANPLVTSTPTNLTHAVTRLKVLAKPALLVKLVVEQAFIASLALKKSKKHNNSTSSFNLRLKRASAGVIISGPSDFRRLATPRSIASAASSFLSRNPSIVSERIDSVSMLFDEAASLEISGNDLQLPAELVAPDVILETATEASDSDDADESSTDTSSAEDDSAEILQPLVALEHDAEIAKAMQETELGSGATLPAEENQDIAAEQRDKRSELALPSVVSTEYKNEESVASQSPFVTVAMKDSPPVDLADDAVVSSIGLYDSEHPDFSEIDTFKCPSLDRDLTEIANGKYPTSTTVTQKQRTY